MLRRLLGHANREKFRTVLKNKRVKDINDSQKGAGPKRTVRRIAGLRLSRKEATRGVRPSHSETMVNKWVRERREERWGPTI